MRPWKGESATVLTFAHVVLQWGHDLAAVEGL